MRYTSVRAIASVGTPGPSTRTISDSFGVLPSGPRYRPSVGDPASTCSGIRSTTLHRPLVFLRKRVSWTRQSSLHHWWAWTSASVCRLLKPTFDRIITPHAPGYFRCSSAQTPQLRVGRSAGIGCEAMSSLPSAYMRRTSSCEMKTMGMG